MKFLFKPTMNKFDVIYIVIVVNLIMELGWIHALWIFPCAFISFFGENWAFNN